ADHFGDLPGQLDVRDIGAQILAHLAADVVHVLDDAVQGTVLLDPLLGGLWTHAWHARHVVRGIAAECREVRVLLRVTPYFSSTASGVKRWSSETPRRVYRTVMSSSTSCRESRSPVQMSVFIPASWPCVASEAMMSSAS